MSIPNELIDEFVKGNGVLFVGPGFAQEVGSYDIEKITHQLITEIDEFPARISDLSTVAHYYELAYGRQRLVTRLRDEFGLFGQLLPSVYELIVQLPVNLIFTTTYDNLIENALHKVGRRYNTVADNINVSFFSNTQMQLVKLRGDLSQPNTITITTRDYEEYNTKYSSLTRLLTLALQTKTVLFIGYTASDYDFRQLLAQVRSEAGNLARRAYSLLLDADRWTIKDLEQKGIEGISLTDDDESVRQVRDRSKVLEDWIKEFSTEIRDHKKQNLATEVKRIRILPAEPFKFLDFYSEKDAAIFHGRNHEIEDLLGLVLSRRLRTCLKSFP